MADDIFGDQPLNDAVSLDTLVGEGKKYKDVDALAKAYANLDNFVEEVKRDNATLRAERDAKAFQNAQGNQEQARQPDPANTPSETPKPQVNEKDLRTLVSEVMEDTINSRRLAENVETTAAKMIEIYGSASAAQQAIINKARELGVTPDWLRDASARSPQAFFVTMGVDPSNGGPRQNRSTPAPHSDVRIIPDVNGNNNGRNYNYYQELRKTNKAAYYSANVQAEMQKNARELGDAFYS